MRFFTSDTHFGHARINELSGRPFSSVDEMNGALIERWNSVVKSSDTVFHLGDVALGQISESLPLVDHLNGVKILIPGNHDRIFPTNKQSHIDRFMPIYEHLFDYIYSAYGGPIGLANGQMVWASHFPYTGDSHADDRYPEFRPTDNGLPLLHGHVHEMWQVNGRQFNVGVDVNDFAPISEDDLIDRIEAHNGSS